MQQQPWNHNLHYHPLVLSAMPPHCARALDVGCGDGRLTHKLAQGCGQATGIDADAAILRTAAPGGKVTFLEGNFLAYPFPAAGFDFITMVATLHHLPLLPALQRCEALLRPGGVLVIVGLYRPSGVVDHAWAAAGFVVSRCMRRVRAVAGQQAPMQPPQQTLPQVRAAVRACLPGAALHRLLLFRYALVWRKPSADRASATA